MNGIERFITLTYSKNDNYAGMFGFIVGGNPRKIVNTLKQKVRAFHPSETIESLLKQQCADMELSFQSKHLCKNNKEIHLYHLFFDFVSK